MESAVINSFNPRYAGQAKESDRHRRLRVVIIDVPFIELFTQGHVSKCKEGLPEDANYIGAVVVDSLALSVALVFEHQSFTPVPSNHNIPMQRIIHEQVTE